MENISKYYYIEEFPEGMFCIILKLMDRYEWKDPGLMGKT